MHFKIETQKNIQLFINFLKSVQINKNGENLKLLCNKSQGWLFMQNNQSYGNSEAEELCIKAHFKANFFNSIQGDNEEKYSLDFQNSSILKMVKGISKNIEKIFFDIAYDERLEEGECLFQVLVLCGREGNLKYQRTFYNDNELNMQQDNYFEEIQQQENLNSEFKIQKGFLKAVKEMQNQILEFKFFPDYISIVPKSDETDRTINIDAQYLNDYNLDILSDGISKSICIPENRLIPQTHIALKMKCDLQISIDCQQLSRHVGVYCSSKQDNLKMVSFFKSAIQELDLEMQPDFQQRAINQTSQMQEMNQQFQQQSYIVNNNNISNYQNDQSTHIQQQLDQNQGIPQSVQEDEDEYENKFKSNYVTDEENIQSNNNTQLRPTSNLQQGTVYGQQQQFIQPQNNILNRSSDRQQNNEFQGITNSNRIVELDEQVRQLNKNSVTKGLDQINKAKQQNQQLNFQFQQPKRPSPYNQLEIPQNSEEQRRRKQIKISSNSNFQNPSIIQQQQLLKQGNFNSSNIQTNQSATSSLNFYSESNNNNNNGYQSGSEQKIKYNNINNNNLNQNFIQSDKFGSKGISSIAKQDQSNFLNNTSIQRQSEMNINNKINNQMAFRKTENQNIGNININSNNNSNVSLLQQKQQMGIVGNTEQKNLLAFMNENKQKNQGQNPSIFQSTTKGIQMATQNSLNNSTMSNINSSKVKFKF